MLTHLRIRNFKRFGNADIELGDVVVFIGPNNSGKTSALQALALWELGVRRWSEKRAGKEAPTKRTGVAINRRDLLALPLPETNLLWHDLNVREGGRSADGKARTSNIHVEIEADGVSEGREWSCGLEFDYANPESIYCRPLGMADGNVSAEARPVPEAANKVRIAFLPPMSGLAAREDRLERGSVQVRLGEGRTAEVLRNLCYQLSSQSTGEWDLLVARIKGLFGVTIELPEYIAERGELVMAYRDRRDIRLDLSASGRGLQQTLLLLAYILGNPGSVLLLDEPDAHLEILRQRQIYAAIGELAREKGCQVIAASHSEVILNEAADRDILVAFVGRPHRIDDRGSQVLKALKSIGFEHYYLAESKGWVLYLEGSTDLAILAAFARTLNHPAQACLEQPFVHYIENQPQKARDHFYGISEAKRDIVGVVVTDNLGTASQANDRLIELQWKRREIENYVCFPEVLESYARKLAEEPADGELFIHSRAREFVEAMRACVAQRVPPAALADREDRYWLTTKASDDFLDPVFEAFFKQVKLPNLMRKTDYHQLASLVPQALIADEVREKLDMIAQVAARAKPQADEPAEDGDGISVSGSTES